MRNNTNHIIAQEVQKSMLGIHDTPTRQFTPDYRLDPPRERPHVFICRNCGEGINDGDDYFEIRDEKYCMACMKEAKHTARKIKEGR